MTDCLACPGAKPKPAEDGKQVCFACSNRILRHLRELEEYLPHLSLLPSRGDGSRGRPGFGSATPVNDAVIHHTDWRTTPSALDGMGAVATVHEWANLLRDGRGLQPPARTTFIGEVEALRVHHSWIVCQDFVGDYARELREITAAVRAVAGDPVTRSVGKCTAITVYKQGECGADVYEMPDATGVKCSDGSCGKVYDGVAMLRLQLANRHPEQEAG